MKLVIPARRRPNAELQGITSGSNLKQMINDAWRWKQKGKFINEDRGSRIRLCWRVFSRVIIAM